MGQPPLDDHGQPDAWLNAARRCDRAIQEMLGFAQGVVTDGVVNNDEVEGFRAWLRQNPDVCVGFPGKEIHDRLSQIFKDGRIDPDEREELKILLEDLTGFVPTARPSSPQRSSALPLNDPPPRLSFEGECYVITGRFMFGARRVVASELQKRGALVEDTVTRRTDVLLVGSVASRDWIQSPWGRKIEKAVEYRANGHRPAIVAEDHWITQLR